MRPHHVKRNCTLLEDSDQERPRNAENVRCALSCELLVFRDDRDRFAGLQIFEDEEKNIVNSARQFDLVTVRADQLRRTSLNQASKLSNLLFFGMLDGDRFNDCWSTAHQLTS